MEIQETKTSISQIKKELKATPADYKLKTEFQHMRQSRYNRNTLMYRKKNEEVRMEYARTLRLH
jgi:hypothetical protein